MVTQKKYLISPNIEDTTLTQKIVGSDENNKSIKIEVIKEKSLTIFLNRQEIVTLMYIGDHPKYLAMPSPELLDSQS